MPARWTPVLLACQIPHLQQRLHVVCWTPPLHHRLIPHLHVHMHRTLLTYKTPHHTMSSHWKTCTILWSYRADIGLTRALCHFLQSSFANSCLLHLLRNNHLWSHTVWPWTVIYSGHCLFIIIKVVQSSCRALASIPLKLTQQSLSNLVYIVDHLHLCAGHPDKHLVQFASARKGVLRSCDGSVAASIDD